MHSRPPSASCSVHFSPADNVGPTAGVDIVGRQTPHTALQSAALSKHSGEQVQHFNLQQPTYADV